MFYIFKFNRLIKSQKSFHLKSTAQQARKQFMHMSTSSEQRRTLNVRIREDYDQKGRGFQNN